MNHVVYLLNTQLLPDYISCAKFVSDYPGITEPVMTAELSSVCPPAGRICWCGNPCSGGQ